MFLYLLQSYKNTSQVAPVVKNPPANAGDMRCGFDPWVGKIPWRRAWQPTPVFLPGESHGQRNLVGYSPWSCKELDMTEATQHAQRPSSLISDLFFFFLISDLLSFSFPLCFSGRKISTPFCLIETPFKYRLNSFYFCGILKPCVQTLIALKV